MKYVVIVPKNYLLYEQGKVMGVIVAICRVRQNIN